MATLTVQDIVLGGITPTYAAADVAGDAFPNDGRTFLHYKNTNAAARNVTVDSVRPCDQGTDHNQIQNVPATTGDKMLGPFPPARFNQTSGNVNVTYDAVTNLTVAAIRLPG